MKFLDIKLTKDSMLFTVPSNGGFKKKHTYSSLVLKSEQKNPRNKKTVAYL
jgi:hypothetical protein